MPKTNMEPFSTIVKRGPWRPRRLHNELAKSAGKDDTLDALVRGILRGQRYEDLYSVARHIAEERGIEL